MEFWPANFEASSIIHTKTSRKGKRAITLDDHSIPFGSLGAAAVTRSHAGSQWITLVNSRVQPRLKFSQPAEIFPPTRAPPLTSSVLSVHERAEQGARFLRTYHPNVDVPFKIIKEELQADGEALKMRARSDPYAGNCLAYLTWQSETKQGHFLAFPSGSAGSELNVSPFLTTSGKSIIFQPSAVPVAKFHTPICQLGAFYHANLAPEKHSLLAVRTYNNVEVIELQNTARSETSGDECLFTANSALTISSTDIRDANVVDMSCGPQLSPNIEMLFVDNTGMLYTCRIGDSRKLLSSVGDSPIVEDSGNDGFWRVNQTHHGTCCRISGKRAHLLDLRSHNGVPREIFSLSDSNEFITSVETEIGLEHLMSFSTTRKLLWYDIRNFTRPLISLRHQRDFDRSLRLNSIPGSTRAFTALSSSKNDLVTIYDVTRLESGHIQINDVPSILPSSYANSMGSIFFQHPVDDVWAFSYIRLSSRGSLAKTDIHLTETPIENNSGIEVVWDETVNDLAEKAKTMTNYIGPLGEREFVEANLRKILEKLLELPSEIHAISTFDDISATIEMLPHFWQIVEAPVEQMLTTFDMTFRSGVEPCTSLRTDFLAGTILNSAEGVAALSNRRIPSMSLAAASRWCIDVAFLPSFMVPDVTKTTDELLRMLSIQETAGASSSYGVRRAMRASQTLAVDLTLSRHVYAPPIPVKAIHERNSSDELSVATRAMSLSSSGPPALHFGFLQPTEEVGHEDEDEATGQGHLQALRVLLGVRSILSEWDVGTNPHEYIYRERYSDDDASWPTVSTARKIGQNAVKSTQVSHPSSAPPVVIPSRPHLTHSATFSQTGTQRTQPERSMTQDIEGLYSIHRSDATHGQRVETRHSDLPMPDNQSSSQELSGPSTQPLAGPFGNKNKQLGGNLKRGVKKRIGGF